MRGRTVDHPTRARRRAARWTPAERGAAAAVLVAWAAGALLHAGGLESVPVRFAAARLDPGLPSPAELAARLGASDPRIAWYAAGLALREERRRAGSGPGPIDPSTADRAEWDRLPGVGPITAEAILAVRDRRGGFKRPEDLLEVPGVGPKTLERIRPYLVWRPGPGPGGTGKEPRPDADPGGAAAPRKPDLDRVDEAFLADLPGIGPHLATAILRERGRRGGFRDWADVRAIEGVGPSRLAVLQNATRLSKPRPSAEREGNEDR